jgi:hypothetical protein
MESGQIGSVKKQSCSCLAGFIMLGEASLPLPRPVHHIQGQCGPGILSSYADTFFRKLADPNTTEGALVQSTASLLYETAKSTATGAVSFVKSGSPELKRRVRRHLRKNDQPSDSQEVEMDQLEQLRKWEAKMEEQEQEPDELDNTSDPSPDPFVVHEEDGFEFVLSTVGTSSGSLHISSEEGSQGPSQLGTEDTSTSGVAGAQAMKGEAVARKLKGKAHSVKDEADMLG